MKKLFISQPIKDRTLTEIMDERRQAVQAVQQLYHEPVEVLNPFSPDMPNHNGLWLLGRNLEFMSEADVVVFAPEWKNHTNCKIEQFCAMDYGIESIEL